MGPLPEYLGAMEKLKILLVDPFPFFLAYSICQFSEIRIDLYEYVVEFTKMSLLITSWQTLCYFFLQGSEFQQNQWTNTKKF